MSAVSGKGDAGEAVLAGSFVGELAGRMPADSDPPAPPEFKPRTPEGEAARSIEAPRPPPGPAARGSSPARLPRSPPPHRSGCAGDSPPFPDPCDGTRYRRASAPFPPGPHGAPRI